MATWYVSSVAYAAIAAFQTSHAYVIGDIVRPTAAAEGRKQSYRCTTGGTSAGTESAWTVSFGATSTQGTAVFTAIGGDTYGWTAALGDLKTVQNISTANYMAIGDNCYVANNHSESNASTFIIGSGLAGAWSTATTHVICVDPAGSVPPVPADITTGASVSFSGGLFFEALAPTRYDGIAFVMAGANNIFFNSSTYGTHYFKNSTVGFSNAGATLRIVTNNPASLFLDNTALSFANAGQGVQMTFGYSMDITWINTASPLTGTAPTTLFQIPTNAACLVTCRGVDFSGYTGNISNITSTGGPQKVLLDSCNISATSAASSALLNGTPGQATYAVVELVNCWDGTNVLNTRVNTRGTVSTERTIVLTGGAADDIGGLSFKIVTNSSKLDKYVVPLDCFYFDVENTATGTSKTATIEINASAALNNDEVWMRLEYMGTSGNPIASFVDSLPATILTAASALSTSTTTWSSSPATPVPQKLTATFTPQRAGRVRAQVFVGKASTTIYVNPQITIS